MTIQEQALEKIDVLRHNKTIMAILSRDKFQHFFRKKNPEHDRPGLVKQPPLIEKIRSYDRPDQLVEPELALWLANGREVRSLYDLASSLGTISAKVFSFHSKKKDVAAWIRDILEMPDVAEAFQRAKNREQAAGVIQRKIREFRNKTGSKEPFPQDFSDADSLENISFIQDSLKRKQRELGKKEAELASKARELEEEKLVLAKAGESLEAEKERIFLKNLESKPPEKSSFRLVSDAEKIRIGEERIEKHSRESMSGKHDQFQGIDFESDERHPFMFKGELAGLLEKTKNHFENNEKISAERTKEKIKELLKVSTLSPRDKKVIRDKVLEMEINMKIRSLEEPVHER